jgi:hypothetical protein
MMGELIVGTSALLALAFCVGWIVSPALRAWLERPKHRFQSQIQGYDRLQRESTGSSRRPRGD